MCIEWHIDGFNWRETICAPLNSNPTELCSLAIERIVKKNGLEQESKKLEFGLFLIAHHEQMNSQNEHFICYTPLALANAGFHSLSRSVEQKIKNILDTK